METPFFATLNLGTNIDLTGAQKGLQQLQNEVKGTAPKLNIAESMKGVDTGNAQGILNLIKQQAGAVESVIVKQRTLKNVAGETITGLTGMTVKYRDANGNLLTTFKQIESAASQSVKGFKISETTEATLNLGNQEKKLTALMQTRLETNKKIGQQGDDIAAKAKNWDPERRKQAEALNKVLQEQVKSYEEIAKSGSKAGLKKTENEIKTTKAELDKLNSSVQTGSGAFSSFGTHLQNAIKQVSAYTLALQAWRMTQQAINETIKFTIQLNSEMVKIQVLQAEGAQTNEEIAVLARSYNQLAKEMGTTTIEIAKGSVEWLRQGKTIAQTTELLRASTMLAKLGNLQAAESTEYLTSTLNSFGMEAEEAVSVVDKLIAVDNKSATSSKELATALRYSAAMADGAGVSLEQLISYIGVVSSTTRQNAESIGQGMKTMLARMQDIKAGAIDEDGLGINNVDLALKRVGMTILDTSGEFKDMGPVLEELAGKWDSLNTVEQENIAKAIAGVRQQNMFKILMEEMPEALKLQEEQLNSTGLAVDRFNYYLNSVEGSQNRLKAAQEEFILTLNKLDGVIIFTNNLLASIIELGASMGGLNTALILAVTALSMYITTTEGAILVTNIFKIKAILSLITYLKMQITTLYGIAVAMGGVEGATIATSIAFRQLAAAMAANPYMWAILLLGVVVSIAANIETASEKMERLNKEIIDSETKVRDLGDKKRNINELVQEFEKLKELNDLGVLDEKQQKRYFEVQKNLKEQIPGLIVSYDEFGNTIIKNTDNLKELTAATYAQIEADKAAELQKIQDTAGERASAFDFEAGKLISSTIRGVGAGTTVKPEKKLIEDRRAYEIMLAQEKAFFQSLGKNAQDNYIAGLSNPEIKKTFINYQEELAYEATAAYWENYAKYMNKVQAGGKGILKTEIDDNALMNSLNKIGGKIKILTELKAKAQKGELLSPAEITTLESMGVGLENVNGKYIITDESAQAFIESQYQEIYNYRELTPEQKKVVDNYLSMSLAINNVTSLLDDYNSATSVFSSALKEQDEAGKLNLETVLKLIETGYESLLVFDAQTNSFRINEQAAREKAAALMEATAADLEEKANALDNAAANREQAQALRDAAEAAREKARQLRSGETDLYTPSGGGGGSGPSAQDLAMQFASLAIEQRINDLEARREKIQAKIDKFKEYIEKQKESLQLQKEEKEYNDDIIKQNRKLGDVKAEIALLALDSSQEAQAKRLKLEEQAAGMEEEIAKTTADREYDLKVAALDKEYEKFQNQMEKKITAIDNQVAAYRRQIEAMNEIKQLQDLAAQAMIVFGQTGDQVLSGILTELGNMGVSLDGLTKNKLRSHIDAIGSVSNGWDPILTKANQYYYTLLRAANLKPALPGFHSGGIVETHHEGNFAGNLNSNEVFAKLLKGEYVATEGQMKNFLQNVLPKVMGRPSPTVIGGGSSNVSVSMPVTVNGNMDSSVLPEMDKIADKVIKQINKAIMVRGNIRSSNQTVA